MLTHETPLIRRCKAVDIGIYCDKTRDQCDKTRHQYICMSQYPFAYQPIYVYANICVCLYMCMPICVYAYMCVCLYVCMSIHPFAYMCVCLYTCMSIHLFFYRLWSRVLSHVRDMSRSHVVSHVRDMSLSPVSRLVPCA